MPNLRKSTTRSLFRKEYKANLRRWMFSTISWKMKHWSNKQEINTAEITSKDIELAWTESKTDSPNISEAKAWKSSLQKTIRVRSLTVNKRMTIWMFTSIIADRWITCQNQSRTRNVLTNLRSINKPCSQTCLASTTTLTPSPKASIHSKKSRTTSTIQKWEQHTMMSLKKRKRQLCIRENWWED